MVTAAYWRQRLSKMWKFDFYSLKGNACLYLNIYGVLKAPSRYSAPLLVAGVQRKVNECLDILNSSWRLYFKTKVYYLSKIVVSAFPRLPF